MGAAHLYRSARNTPMTFKKLYYSLILFLTGLLVSVFFSSERLDKVSYGNPTVEKQFAVSTPAGELKEGSFTLRYSTSVYRRLGFPVILSGVLVIAIVLGIAADRAEAKNRPNQAPEPTPTTVTPPAGQEARQP